MKNRLDECLSLAIKNHASDIHFMLKDGQLKIEFRINKHIYPLKTKSNDECFYRYLMYKANLDLAKRLQPQTGNFEYVLNDKKLSLRFSCVDTINMSCGVLRILNNHYELAVNNLTNDRDILNSFERLKLLTSGLIVFSGPTGSGKTTTLYTILKSFRQKKIFTLEDPVEVYDDSYVQLQINEAADFGYAQGIKQLMRHDPDVIMIGEIRDEVAASMAVRCALTGHLVLTTIHASSSMIAIERLLELGVMRLQLKDVLMGVYNQRLVHLEDETIGVYELMDRYEIEYFFNHECMSDNHVYLKEKLEHYQK